MVKTSIKNHLKRSEATQSLREGVDAIASGDLSAFNVTTDITTDITYSENFN
ncbi:MAG: hypothetical protein Hyperionvirus15_6 [Hyperionvirus sp.]|uniref:Uncharacterized protein n=1 Tax=Hyperionvirus sp. TaxID=2487770 RepID=A0A3G5A9M4_9VIRU|nr:MAG: hypothetical protein Hyperionvirus15_6 [Hyperionvirus sp.]